MLGVLPDPAPITRPSSRSPGSTSCPTCARAEDASRGPSSRSRGTVMDVSTGLELSAYRIMQEALTNVRRQPSRGRPVYV